MNRPCYMVVDREFVGSISTRKLVLETAKLNVITTYDADEAIGTLQRFPKVDGVVFSSALEGITVEQMILRLRSIVPNIPVIVTAPATTRRAANNEYYVDSLNPKDLLECLQKLNKEAIDEIARRDPEIQQ